MAKFNSNQIISKVIKYGDRLIGYSAGKLKNAATVMHEAEGMGIRNVPESVITRSRRLAEVAKGRSTKTRIKTGLGVSTATIGGFLGLHKYHQHKDNKIMERIDNNFKVS